MTKTIDTYCTSLVIVLLLGVNISMGTPGGIEEPGYLIRQAIDEAVAGDTYGAILKLDALPDGLVVEAIAEKLQHDSRFGEQKLRSFGYTVLGRKSAAKSDVGYPLLVSGLLEPEHRTICASSLHDAPESRRSELTSKFLALLGDATTVDAAKIKILNNLASYGESARSALPVVEQIFNNRNSEQSVRFMSFLAMLRLGPIEQALAHVREEDAKAALPALARLREFVPSSFNTDDRNRLRIYDLVLSGLRDKDPDVRRAAMEAIGPIFAENMFVIRSQADFELLPSLGSALNQIARDDSEVDLRNNATKLLDRGTQAKYVAKIIEKKGN